MTNPPERDPGEPFPDLNETRDWDYENIKNRSKVAAPSDTKASEPDVIERDDAMLDAFQRDTGIWLLGRDKPAAMGVQDERELRSLAFTYWQKVQSQAALPRNDGAPKVVVGAPGICFSIDGEWWHEPGSCPHCTAPPGNNVGLLNEALKYLYGLQDAVVAPSLEEAIALIERARAPEEPELEGAKE